MICEWFLKCTNEAEGFIIHPILGEVPCCQRCADIVGEKLVRTAPPDVS